MSARQISQWRSVGFAFASLLVLAGVLVVIVLVGKVVDPVQIAGMFGSLAFFAGASVGFAFGKSLGEKLGAGTGVKGALAALMTDAKPGEPGKES